MQPAEFFGFNVETWLGLLMAVLGTVAAVLVAKQKRRRWAELGDGEEVTPQDDVQRDHWYDTGSDKQPPR